MFSFSVNHAILVCNNTVGISFAGMFDLNSIKSYSVSCLVLFNMCFVIISGDDIWAFAYAEPQGRYNLNDLSTTASLEGDNYVINGYKLLYQAALGQINLLFLLGHQVSKETLMEYLY